MIGTRTTFVVGAGGSDPYGLPVGKALAKEARELSIQSDVYPVVVDAVGEAGIVTRVLEQLCEAVGLRTVRAYRERPDAEAWLGAIEKGGA